MLPVRLCAGVHVARRDEVRVCVAIRKEPSGHGEEMSEQWEKDRAVWTRVMAADKATFLDADEDIPHGWIQWKGTKVCMDLLCACGSHGHVDAEFCYFVKCTDCGRRYFVAQNVKLIELREDEEEQGRLVEFNGADDQ